MWKKIKKSRFLLLMLLPGSLYLIGNNYIPMFGAVIAFKNINYAKGILHSPWVGLDNFKYLFITPDAWVITRNTILYNLAFIVLTLVLSSSFAIMLNEIRNRLASRFYQNVMFLPYFLSAIVVGYLGYSFLSEQYGFLNEALKWIHVKPISWYNDPQYWPFILPLVYVWKNIGYSTVIYLAAVVGIDRVYYEAAVIDGASKWQQVVHVTLPHLRPIMIILTLLGLGHILNADFGLFYQVPLDSGPLYSTTNVIDTYVYRALLNMGNIGMSSAAGLYQSVVGFVLVLGTNYAVRKISSENALF